MTCSDVLSEHFTGRLEKLFAQMDHAYAAIADHYGFSCKGCAENCCRSLFYHHCLLEYTFLHAGFKTLEERMKKTVLQAAEDVHRQTAADEAAGRFSRRMCPLNREGLCVLYFYRPMICRLHGVPHQLTKSGHPTAFGPGCDTFARRCRGKVDFRFDRTPFYEEMAFLENEFRKAVGFTGKMKMTVARMILDCG